MSVDEGKKSGPKCNLMPAFVLLRNPMLREFSGKGGGGQLCPIWIYACVHFSIIPGESISHIYPCLELQLTSDIFPCMLRPPQLDFPSIAGDWFQLLENNDNKAMIIHLT